MDESYTPTEQDQKDLAMMDDTTDFYKIATKNFEELVELDAPAYIVSVLDDLLEEERALIEQGIYDIQSHTKLVTAWTNAQNWLAEHRGGIA